MRALAGQGPIVAPELPRAHFPHPRLDVPRSPLATARRQPSYSSRIRQGEILSPRTSTHAGQGDDTAGGAASGARKGLYVTEAQVQPDGSKQLQGEAPGLIAHVSSPPHSARTPRALGGSDSVSNMRSAAAAAAAAAACISTSPWAIQILVVVVAAIF